MPRTSSATRAPDREQKLIEGAKKEGQVIIYSALIVNQAMRPIADHFGKKYPFIKLTYWRADSEDIVAEGLPPRCAPTMSSPT